MWHKAEFALSQHPQFSTLKISITPYEGQPMPIPVAGVALPLTGVMGTMQSGLSLYFKTPLTSHQAVFALKKSLSDKLGYPVFVSFNMVSVRGSEHISDAYTKMVASNGRATAAERSDIMAFLNTHLAETMEQNTTVGTSETAAHAAVIEATHQASLDALLEGPDNPFIVVKLLRLAIFYPDTTIETTLPDFLSANGLDEALYDDVILLNRVCTGNANLESTHMRMGGIPDIESQRILVFNQASDALLEKFAVLEPIDKIRLYCELWMFNKMHDKYHPLEDDAADIFERCLGGELTPEEVQTYGLDQYINNGCIAAGLNTPTGLDLEAVSAMAEEIDSPFLRALVQEPQALKANRDRATQDPFYNALKKGHVELAEGFLHFADATARIRIVNQYFPFAGRTPLIMACQLEDATARHRMMRLLLDSGAEPARMNHYGIFNPVFVCLDQADVVGLEMLLAAGASLTAPCHGMMGAPLQSAQQLMRDKSEDRLAERQIVFAFIRDSLSSTTASPSVVAALASQSVATGGGHQHAQLVTQIKAIVGNDALLVPVLVERNYPKALRRACTAGSEETALNLVQLLLTFRESYPFDLDEQVGTQQRTALYHAARKGYASVYRALVAAGADPECVSHDGSTPRSVAEEKSIALEAVLPTS